MSRRILSALILVSTLSLVPASSSAQLGNLIQKKKAPDPSGKAPEYSDADKAKLAELAQRPAVQEEIQTLWDAKRNEDMTEAFAINQTATWGLTDDPVSHIGYTSTSSRLYSNPMIQTYINTIGQRLVPKDSPNFYTFRILLDPRPEAISLSTGSIYISSGLLAMLDSEAQLSYIMAHEIAHVEQKHAYNKIRNQVLEDELNKEKEAKVEKTKEIIALAGALGGGLLGGITRGIPGALVGGLAGLGGADLLANLLVHPGIHSTEWSTVEENEADELGAKYMLNQGYDAREIPRLYASLDTMVAKDSRVGMSFMGEPRRVKERIGHIKEMLNGPLKPQVEALVKSGKMVGSGSTFPVLLSAAKRDNGIVAMEYDLFAEARQNLEDSLEQRSNDPTVHFYLSKVMALTAKTPEEQNQAVAHIANAIRLDAARGSIPDLHLEYAISLVNQGNAANKDQVISELKTYVALYQRDNAGRLPANMSAIFDYFNLEGESTWYLPPDWYPATQLSNTTLPSTVAPDAVVRKATGSAVDAAVEATPVSTTPQPANKVPASKGKVKN